LYNPELEELAAEHASNKPGAVATASSSGDGGPARVVYQRGSPERGKEMKTIKRRRRKTMRARRAARSPVRACRRLIWEPLEPRRVLTTFLVTDPGDAGPGTLREAIGQANASSGLDEIQFDPGLSGSSILLTSTELLITDSLIIDASDLVGGMTIDASGADSTPTVNDGAGIRIFRMIDNSSGTPKNVTLTHLTLTGGDVTGNGGGLLSFENLTLDHVTFDANAATQSGGGALIIADDDDYSVLVRDSRFTNNAGSFGGGLFAYSRSEGMLNVIDSFFQGNEAVNGGGLVTSSYLDGRLSVTGVVARTNRADQMGGGLLALTRGFGDESTIAGSTFEDNIAATGGGAFLYPSIYATIHLNETTITGNSAASGGGLYIRPFYADAALRAVEITGNEAQTGGGVTIYAYYNQTTISQSTISRNSATASGGGIHSQARFLCTLTIDESLIGDNESGGSGGGIYAYGYGSNVTVRESSVTGNRAMLGVAPGGGGGIAAFMGLNSYLALSDSTVLGNETDAFGGGVLIDGPASVVRSQIEQNVARAGGGLYATLSGDSFALRVSDSEIADNLADSAAGMSVDAANQARVFIEGTTLHGNRAVDSAGGASLHSTGLNTSIRIQNSTLSGNSAGQDGGGAVAQTDSDGVIELRHATVAGNTAGANGGGIDASTPVQLNHVIVGDNQGPAGGDDLSGALFVGDFNLVESLLPGSQLSGQQNILDKDPALMPLSDNGGPTPTHALQFSSAALNSGDPGFSGPPDFDQRGNPFARVQFGRIDRGAFEVDQAPSGDFNADGHYDCQDIDALTALIATAAYDVDFDLNLDGVLDLADLELWLAEAGAVNLPSGNSFLFGDANLDGSVDGTDFLIWNQHKFTANAAWCSGDFNADGFVSGLDFVIWNSNKFSGQASGDWRVASGEGRVVSGKWQVASGKGQVASGRRKTGAGHMALGTSTDGTT
jgi:hypothetical protein